MLIELDCHHTAEYNPPPFEGDEVYCGKCGQYRQVTLHVKEWRIKCQKLGCPRARRYGADETAARRAAGDHAARYPGHKVKLWLGGSVVQVYESSGTPIADWHRANPDHQAKLRAVVERRTVTDL